MNQSADTDLRPLLRLARTGSGAALGELLEWYRNYLTLLARLQIGRVGKEDGVGKEGSEKRTQLISKH
jgi:hypothetical protein